jgi:hypothetical protein
MDHLVHVLQTFGVQWSVTSVPSREPGQTQYTSWIVAPDNHGVWAGSGQTPAVALYRALGSLNAFHKAHRYRQRGAGTIQNLMAALDVPERGSQVSAEVLRAALRAFVDAENADAGHAGIAQYEQSSTEHGVTDLQLLSGSEERIEIEKFVAWWFTQRPALSIGNRVVISGTPYTGEIVSRVDTHLVIELDGQHDEPPTDLCWQSEQGTMLWPCFANEIEPEPAPSA